MLPVHFLLGSKFSSRHSTVRLNCVRLLVLVGFSCLHAPGAGRVCWQLLESMEWLMTDDDDQKNLRRASAQSFFQSLDELFDYIESNSSPAAEPQSRPPQAKPSSQFSSPPQQARPAESELCDYIESSSSPAADPQSRPPQAKPSSQFSSPPKQARPAKINLSDFEDAIADLEQFIQNKRQKRPESNQ